MQCIYLFSECLSGTKLKVNCILVLAIIFSYFISKQQTSSISERCLRARSNNAGIKLIGRSASVHPFHLF